MTGDLVEFEALRGGGSIEEILPRRNALVRPMAANIDKLLLVLSAGKPAPDLILADKLLIQAEKNKIEPVILINKTDMDRIQAEAIRRQYACYAVLLTSARTNEGIGPLKEILRGKSACFAGQ